MNPESTITRAVTIGGQAIGDTHLVPGAAPGAHTCAARERSRSRVPTGVSPAGSATHEREYRVPKVASNWTDRTELERAPLDKAPNSPHGVVRIVCRLRDRQLWRQAADVDSFARNTFGAVGECCGGRGESVWLPLDWSAKAVQAASATIQICAQANTLQPPKCPQQIPSGGEVLSAQWKILDAPLAHAIAISSQQDPSEGSADPSQVTVFGRYQMSVSYTRTGQALRPFLDFAGGIARATMTWDGSSFQNVTFATYPVTDLPSGVCIAPFSRPPGVSDATALQLVQAGFRDCVTILVTPSMTDPPNCPQRFEVLDLYFVDLQVTLNGDPMHGALVTFDTARGDVAVTGSYSMTLNSTRRVPGQADDPQSRTSAGNYTAFLAWDGQQLQLLDIATT